MENTITFNGAKYVTCEALSFGDYGGAGSVGRANINCLIEDPPRPTVDGEWTEEKGSVGHAFMSAFNWPQGEIKHWRTHDYAQEGTPTVLILIGDYSSEQAYIRVDCADEIINALSDYPAISDEAVGEVEMQWEQEAWDSWLRHDMLGTLPEDEDNDLREKAERMPEPALLKAFYNAMERTNTYFEPEDSGSCVNVERIKDAFADEIAAYDFGPQCTRPSIEDDVQIGLDI